VIAALTAIVFVTACGAGLALRVDRNADPARWIGESFLIGFGLSALVLLGLTFARVHWTLGWFVIVMILAGLPWFKRLHVRTTPLHWIDALTLVTVIGYVLFVTAAAPAEADFVSDWGLKAKVFAHTQGVDWGFLRNGWYWFALGDYPPLVPLSFDTIALFSGGWDDRWLGMINAGFGIAALLVIRSLAAEQLHSKAAAAFEAFAIACILLTPWLGTGDGPLVAYMTVAALFIRRGFITPGAVFLGLGALTKNEGISFVVAAGMAMLLDERLRKYVWRLWPAVLIPAPWLAARAIFRLKTYLATGSVFDRIAAHMHDPQTYAMLLQIQSVGPLLTTGVLIAIVLAWPQWRTKERFVIAAIALQIAFYVAAYVVTPLDVAFHIKWSWERLVWHVTPLLAIVSLEAILPMAAIRRYNV